jgi:hypothetical protein
MNQYQDDRAVVVDKLEKITTLLNNLGKWCTLHGLEERDLPPSLRGIFQALETYVLYSQFSSHRQLMHGTRVDYTSSCESSNSARKRGLF